MKLRFTLLLTTAFTLLFTALSCTKDEGYTPESDAARQVAICITGEFKDFDGIDTKASIENIFRMKWAENDKVYVFGKASGEDVFSCLGTLTATPDAETGNRVADLAGTITVPQTGTKLTLVHSPILTNAPSVTDGAISIDLSSQSGGANDVTFVAYTTVDYKGAADATYRTSFSFATSVLRVNVTNLSASTELTKATLGKIETSCKLAFATDAAPTVTGDNSTGTITRAFTSCSSNAKGTAAFYIAVPSITTNSNRSLTVTQSVSEYDAYGFATGSKAAGSLMNSIADLITTGQHGVLNGQEYVYIKAQYDGTNYSYLKWATQNLAVTDSGKAKWMSTNYQIGDYFQWAAYDGYVSGTKPENLVIYTSFTNTFTTKGCSFSDWKDSKTFAKASAPYGGDSYTKYTGTSGDGKTILEQSDDVANIVLGSTWRMPTGGSAGEIRAMRAVTYWAWDATDKGYYVFKPEVGTSGTAGGRGNIGTDDKTKALLFFPAAGFGNGADLKNASTRGRYWSSTLSSDSIYASFLGFDMSMVSSETGSASRFYGYSVRPVSD